MNKSKIWQHDSKKTITRLKRFLGGLAESVRTEQYGIFAQIFKLKENDKVLVKLTL